MSTRPSRIDGGAYRQHKNMIARHAKPGKDRSKAKRRKSGKRGEMMKSGRGSLYSYQLRTSTIYPPS